ncbi:MAG TPA: hypothetical protein VK438_12455, partial [Xanthobacteraceae bacterium]|nr:hypothetical protein [Xanthobacteraceae bacterium]
MPVVDGQGFQQVLEWTAAGRQPPFRHGLRHSPPAALNQREEDSFMILMQAAPAAEVAQNAL